MLREVEADVPGGRASGAGFAVTRRIVEQLAATRGEGWP
jgi:hypothetical protein